MVKLAEATLTDPIGWLLLLPFFTGLGLHAGWGLWAPVVALGVCLAVMACRALLSSIVDAAQLSLSRSRAFRVLRVAGPMLGLLLFFGWVGVIGLDGLKEVAGLGLLQVDLAGDWLDFSTRLTWLPFSEPARALSSLSVDPRRAFAWLALFAAEMVLLLGAGTLALRRLYRADLVRTRRDRNGARGAASTAERAPRRRSFVRALGPVLSKDLLWLWRNPSRFVWLAFAAALLSAVALVIASRVPGRESNAAPGTSLLGVGLFVLLGHGSSLELERPALGLWSALPRSPSWVFARKALFAAGFSVAVALPVGLYASSSASSAGHGMLGLAYGALCIVLLAFFQTALWIRHVNPNEPTSRLRHGLRGFQLLLIAGVLSMGFLTLRTPSALGPISVLAGAFAFAFWHDSMQRLPFELDRSARRPRVVTATFALGILFLTRTVQSQLLTSAIGGGVSPARATAFSFVGAGVLVLLPSLLWLRIRVGKGLRQRLGLAGGITSGVTLREGLLWSLPALATLGLWRLVDVRWARTAEHGSAQPPVMVQLASSPFAAVFVGCVAAPLMEEILFRGLLYRALRQGWCIRLSLAISAAVFAIDHPLIAIVPVLGLATCATLAFERSRSLRAAMLVHATYNGVIVWIMFSG